MSKKLRTLHQAARTSIGVKSGADSVVLDVSLLVNSYSLIELQVDRLVKSLKELVDKTTEGKYLLSIHGINYLLTAALLAELGPVNSYHSAKQLNKMAGTNPIESESGGKRHGPYTDKQERSSTFEIWRLECRYPSL